MPRLHLDGRHATDPPASCDRTPQIPGRHTGGAQRSGRR